MKRLPLCLLLLSLSACGLDDKPATGTNNGQIPDPAETASSVRDKVEAEVADNLDCSGLIREETRNLISDAIDEADFGADKLVIAPEELARFVGAVAVSTDSTALIVANVAAIASLGHMPTALGGGWDDLTCDEATTEPCIDQLTLQERGSAATTTVCEAGVPTAVRATFSDGCQLFVTQNEGAVELRRSDGAFAFDEFAIGSARQVDGLLSARFTDGEVDRLTVADEAGLSIASNAGKSCEERLTISRLVADFAAEFTKIDLDAERLADEKTVSLSTPDAPATWSKNTACTCPDPGSALQWGWKGFLKGHGDAQVRLNYGEPSGEDNCASVQVDIANWPEACDGEGEAGDCGKSAVEALLAPVFSASCVTRPTTP